VATLNTILKNILNFQTGGPTSIPHGLNVNGVARIPQFIAANASGFTITADATNVTIAPSGNVNVFTEIWHTIEDVESLPGGIPPADFPFIVASGGGSGPDVDAFVFNANALGGVQQNNGTGNAAAGPTSTACGENNRLSGEGSFAEGVGNVETVTGVGTKPNNHLEGGGNTINVAQPNNGSNNHLEGSGNSVSATGTSAADYNHLEGQSNSISAAGGANAEWNHVEGYSNGLAVTAGAGAMSFSHVDGYGHTVANSGGMIEYLHVEGSQHTITSPTDDCSNTHVEGSEHNVTDADASHIEGFGHIVSVGGGTANHVEGAQNSLTGTALTASYAHIEGRFGVGSANTVHVEGDSASGIRETQHAHASGKFTTAGDAQSSSLEMRGSTPGLASGESAELKYGDAANQFLTLEDGKYYALEVIAVAAQTGGGGSAMFRSTLLGAFQEAGVVTLVGPGLIPNDLNTGAGGSWALPASAGVGPARLMLTFSTGDATSAVRVVANVRWTEVARA